LSITKIRKNEIMEEFGRKPGDVGSSEVQIAVLTERINHLSEHFRLNPKDNNSKRGFHILIGRRRRLLAYLKRKNYTSYKQLIAKLGLRR